METRFSAPVQTGPGAYPGSCTMGTVPFPGVKSGRGVTLTPHNLLVPWSRKSRAIPLLPPRAVRPVQSLSTCTVQGCTLPFYFIYIYIYSVISSLVKEIINFLTVCYVWRQPNTQHSQVVTSRHPVLVKRVAHVPLSVKIWTKEGRGPCRTHKRDGHFKWCTLLFFLLYGHECM